MAHAYVNPEAVAKPVNYSHVVLATGSRIVSIAGQVGQDKDGNLVGEGDLAAQTDQTMKNLEACLASVGATFADLIKMTTFVVGYQAARDRPVLIAVRNKYLPADNPPASTLVGVQALGSPGIIVEIEVTAVLP